MQISDTKFWGMVQFLKTNDGYLTKPQRESLEQSASDASKANVLSGIPTATYAYVKNLKAEVEAEIAAAQKKIRRA
jgi:hypothetical protein